MSTFSLQVVPRYAEVDQQGVVFNGHYLTWFDEACTGFLDHLGVTYKGLNVLENEELRNGIKGYSNWPTIPQLYVKGEFVGGCDIVREMFQAGELQQALKDAGVVVKQTA